MFIICPQCHACDCLPESRCCEHCEIRKTYDVMNNIIFQERSYDFSDELYPKDIGLCPDLEVVLIDNKFKIEENFAHTNIRTKRFLEGEKPIQPASIPKPTHEGLYYLKDDFPYKKKCKICKETIRDFSQPYYLKNKDIYHVQCYLNQLSTNKDE